MSEPLSLVENQKKEFTVKGLREDPVTSY